MEDDWDTILGAPAKDDWDTVLAGGPSKAAPSLDDIFGPADRRLPVGGEDYVDPETGTTNTGMRRRQSAESIAADVAMARKKMEARPLTQILGFTARDLAEGGLSFVSSAYRQAKEKNLGEAQASAARGEASQDDVEMLARQQQEQARSQAGGIPGAIREAVSQAPGMLGEALVGGRVVRGGLAAVGLTKTLPTVAGRALQGAATQAAATPFTPSMYAQESQQRANQNGGNWYDPENVAAPLAKAALTNAILGNLNKVGEGKNLASRLAIGAIGMPIEQQAADALATTVEEALKDAGVEKKWLTETKWGTIGNFARGENGEGWKRLATEATLGAGFAAMHGRKADPIIKLKDAVDSLGKKGYSSEKVAEILADAVKDPESAKGPAKEFAETLAESQKLPEVSEKPSPDERRIPPDEIDPNSSGGKEAIKPSETAPEPETARQPSEGEKVAPEAAQKQPGALTQLIKATGLERTPAVDRRSATGEAPGGVERRGSADRLKGLVDEVFGKSEIQPSVDKLTADGVEVKSGGHNAVFRPVGENQVSIDFGHTKWQVGKELKAGTVEFMDKLKQTAAKIGKAGKEITYTVSKTEPTAAEKAEGIKGDPDGSRKNALYSRALKQAGFEQVQKWVAGEPGKPEQPAVWRPKAEPKRIMTPEEAFHVRQLVDSDLKREQGKWERLPGEYLTLEEAATVAGKEGAIHFGDTGLRSKAKGDTAFGGESIISPRWLAYKKAGEPRPSEPTPEKPAAPERAEAPDATSIKNETTAQEREARSIPPAAEADPVGHTFPELADRVEAIAKAEPERAANLVRELQGKPRPVSDLEDAILLRRQVELQNQHDETIGRLEQAKQTGDPAAIAEAEHAEVTTRGQLKDLYDVNKSVGTESGRALNARKMLMARDFTLPKMLIARESAQGRPLTRAEHAEVTALQKKLADAEKRVEAAENQVRVKRIEKVTTAEEPNRAAKARKEVDAAWDDLKKLTQNKFFSTPFDPQLIGATVKLTKAYVKLGVAKFSDFVSQVKTRSSRPLTKEAEDILQQGWNQAHAELAGERKQAAIERMKDVDPNDNPSIGRLAQKLYKMHAQLGVEGMDPRIDAVHTDLKQILPQISRPQTMDAISGYGQYKQLSKEALEAQIRDQKGQMQQLAKLRDMEAKQAPKKTGIERRVPSATERELLKKVNEKKKELGYDVTDRATQLKTALDSAKTRMKNQIEDLTRQIDKGQKDAKSTTPQPTDAELQALVARRDAVKAQFDAVFGRPGISDATRLKMATEATKKAIDEYEARIASKDFSVKGGRKVTAPELEALKARRDALREEFQTLRNQDPAVQKAAAEKSDQQLRAYYAERTAEMKEKLAQGDFSEAERKEPVRSEEALKAQAEYKQAVAEWEKGQKLAERAKESYGATGLRRVGDLIDFERAVKLGGDLPPIFRQGGFVTAGHPILSAKALGQSAQAFKSEFTAHKNLAELSARENAKNGRYQRDMGLDVENIHGQDEFLKGSWIKKIPWFSHTERWHSAYLTRLRADYYDTLSSAFTRNGRKMSEAEGKIIGNAVNAFTGKGTVADMGRYGTLLGKVFLAPNWVLSRYKTALGQPIWYGLREHGLQPRARAILAKEYLRSAIGAGSIYGLAGLAAAAGLAVTTETDPRSSDFGEIKIGNTRLNPLFGLTQVYRLMGQLLAEEKKNPETGKITKAGFGQLVGEEARKKLAPIPSAGVTAKELAAKDLGYSKQGPPKPYPQDWKSLGLDLVEPLTEEDFRKAAKDLGIGPGALAGIFASLGAGVKVFEKK